MRVFGKDIEINIRMTDVVSNLAEKRSEALKITIRYIRTLNEHNKALEAQNLRLRAYERSLQRRYDLLIQDNLKREEKLSEFKQKIDTSDLTKENLLVILEAYPYIPKAELADLFEVSYPTLQVKFEELLEEGLIEQIGRKVVIKKE